MAKRSDPDSEAIGTLCNATAIRMASRRITQFYDASLEPSGLRSTQLAILLEVHGKPTAIGELAEVLATDRSALGHNLRPLVRDGLIELGVSASDRRRTEVSITRLGRERMRAGKKLWAKAQRLFEERIGSARAAEVRKTMFEIARSETLLPRV